MTQYPEYMDLWHYLFCGWTGSEKAHPARRTPRAHRLPEAAEPAQPSQLPSLTLSTFCWDQSFPLPFRGPLVNSFCRTVSVLLRKER